MLAIVMRLVHVRPPPALWGQVAPAATVVLAWTGRITGVRPISLGLAMALTMYGAGIWLIHFALFSNWAKKGE